MNIYAIYDKVAGAYFQLSLWKNDALYKRSLMALANDPNPDNLFSHHAADYQLFCLGQMDEKSGVIIPESRFVCNASDLKES